MGAVGNGNEGSSPGGGSGGRGEGFGPVEGLLNGRGEGIRSLRAGSPRGLLTGAGQRQKVTREPRQSRAGPWRQRALGSQSAGGPGQRHSPALLSYRTVPQEPRNNRGWEDGGVTVLDVISLHVPCVFCVIFLPANYTPLQTTVQWDPRDGERKSPVGEPGKVPRLGCLS